MVSGEWIPIVMFLTIGAIVIAAMYFRNQRLQHGGGGDYRRLAEEATRGQKALLEQMREMNQSLSEIERLLREV